MPYLGLAIDHSIRLDYDRCAENFSEELNIMSRSMKKSPNDQTLERPLPHNLDAERAVLGVILLDNSLCNQAVELLKREDFFFDSHRRIFDKMILLSETARGIDLITIQDELNKTNELEQIGGMAYIASLLDGAMRTSNIEHYAKIIKGKSVMRKLINTCNNIIYSCLDQEADPEEILDEAERQIFQIAEDRIRTGFVSIGEIARKQLDLVEQMSERPQMMTGVPTGFVELDRLTNGLQPADLIIIAARPSVGKTAFGLSISQNASIAAQKVIGVFSLEMTKEALVSRMLCSEAHVDAHRLRGGFLNRDEWARLAAGLQKLAEARIFIDDTAGISILEMRAKARRLKAEHGLDLLVVDYLQLMRGRGRVESRQQEVSQISRELKGLAKELNIPLIALSQLSRASETRTDHRPQLADLRESGCLSGETPIYLPDLGSYKPIKDLVGKRDFRVLALNTNTWQLEPSIVTNAFSTGIKPIYCLKTKLGRTIRATANHKFLTITGWQRLDELVANSRIALPRKLGNKTQATMTNADVLNFLNNIGTLGEKKLGEKTKICTYLETRKENTNRDILPYQIWQQLALPAMVGLGLTHRALQHQLGNAYCGHSLYRQNLSRERARHLAEVVACQQLALLAQSDIYWDEVVSVEPEGSTEVFDLTVEPYHNFVASNIIVHNSIEQDADVVMFIYREEIYNQTEENQGKAEIIIGKQRNGPTDTVRLAFIKQFTRFENLWEDR